ncbi:MAG: hypothetical protein LBD29_06040 [Treponema sp.]|nr:hypothetical protein [Treponema sp.]
MRIHLTQEREGLFELDAVILSYSQSTKENRSSMAASCHGVGKYSKKSTDCTSGKLKYM